MPLHTGHLNLINFGLKHCSKITILLVVTKDEPIKPELRYAWLLENYKENKNITIEVTNRDFINNLPQSERTGAWCSFIGEEYPLLDCIISSESYGDILANHLNITHLKFDHKREMTPISATKIRENFKEHMHYLPENVKNFFKGEQK